MCTYDKHDQRTKEDMLLICNMYVDLMFEICLRYVIICCECMGRLMDQ